MQLYTMSPVVSLPASAQAFGVLTSPAARSPRPDGGSTLSERAILERIAQGAQLAESLTDVVRWVEQQADGMLCSILLLDRKEGCLRIGAAPSLPPEYVQAIDGTPVGPDAGSCGAAAYRGERVVVADIATHPSWARYKHLALNHGLRACWSSPIMSPKREVLGTLAMYYRIPGGPSAREIHWVDAATHLASLAIGRHQSEAERQAAAASLQQREEQIRIMFESAAIGMVLLDVDVRALKCNPAMTRFLGHSEAELCHKRFSEFTHPDDAGPGLALYRSLFAGERDTFQFEKRYVRKDGRVVWGRLTVSTVRRSDSRPLYAIATVEDVTVRKQAEADRARLEAQLRQVQKMQSLETFAGGIAHDFNNILSSIVGNTELAIADTAPGSPVQEHLGHVERGARRAADLVRQIITFSRLEGTRRVVLDPTPVVEDVLKLLRSSLPPSICIQFRPPATLLAIRANANQIHQVVMNLATNAAHAIGARSGVLDVRLDDVLVDANLAACNANLSPGRYARLVMTDSGCGMDADTRHRIFEPFFTTKANGQGTGLGLSVVLGIIQSHEAAIIVDSAPGRGSTFQVFFPMVRSAADKSGSSPYHACVG